MIKRGRKKCVDRVLGPGCPHSRWGFPNQCSQCLGIVPTRLAAIDLRRRFFAEARTPLEKVAALDELIAEVDPEPNASTAVEAEDDHFAPP